MASKDRETYRIRMWTMGPEWFDIPVSATWAEAGEIAGSLQREVGDHVLPSMAAARRYAAKCRANTSNFPWHLEQLDWLEDPNRSIVGFSISPYADKAGDDIASVAELKNTIGDLCFLADVLASAIAG